MTVEASFLRGKGGVLVKLLDFAIELVERGTERARQTVVLGEQRGPVS